MKGKIQLKDWKIFTLNFEMKDRVQTRDQLYWSFILRWKMKLWLKLKNSLSLILKWKIKFGSEIKLYFRWKLHGNQIWSLALESSNVIHLGMNGQAQRMDHFGLIYHLEMRIKLTWIKVHSLRVNLYFQMSNQLKMNRQLCWFFILKLRNNWLTTGAGMAVW